MSVWGHRVWVGYVEDLSCVGSCSELWPKVVDARGVKLKKEVGPGVSWSSRTKGSDGQKLRWLLKQKEFEEFGDVMEDFQLASKKFWQTVRRLRKGKQGWFQPFGSYITTARAVSVLSAVSQSCCQWELGSTRFLPYHWFCFVILMDRILRCRRSSVVPHGWQDRSDHNECEQFGHLGRN